MYGAFESGFEIVVSYRCERGVLSQSLVVSVCLSLALVDWELICRSSGNGLVQLLYGDRG
jgi:hypothetical protein